MSITKYNSALGKATNGKIITVFDLKLCDWSSTGFDAKTTSTRFSFLCFIMGKSIFFKKENLRLKKLTFRITNLEEWVGDHPLTTNFSRRYKKSIGSFSFPPILRLFEDEFVIIQLSTTFNQKSDSCNLTASYYHNVEIKAKGNRKLPYWGDSNSFSYYKKRILDFFCLVTGKNTVVFQIVGLVSKKRILLDEQQKQVRDLKLAKTRHHVYNTVEIFPRRSIDRAWLTELHSREMLLSRNRIIIDIQSLFTKFFEKYDSFGFVLNDWIGMRNKSSFTNHALPELLYNLEGLHRNLYPEYDNEPEGYTEQITAIKSLLSVEQNNLLKNRLRYHFSFRQRLHDIIILRAFDVYPYLSRKNKDKIINDLCKIRNNAAHTKNEKIYDWKYVFPLIIFTEELIVILIFLQLDFSIEYIKKNFNNIPEWTELKRILCKALGHNTVE